MSALGSSVFRLDNAAIGRIACVSANGKHLMPCKLAKARKLVESGKALERRDWDGSIYIQLKFNPSSPVVQSRGDVGFRGVFDSSYLARIREEAKKKRIWFKSLCKADRDVLDLTIKCVNELKSTKLIDVVAKIIVKVKMALLDRLYGLMEQVGRPLAKKLGKFASSWGNKAADKWAEDKGFVRFLTVMDKAFQGSAYH